MAAACSRSLLPALFRIGLFDTRIAVGLPLLFNIPGSVDPGGFMSGCEGARRDGFVDGYPFWRFFVRIFIPPSAGVAWRRSSASCSLVELLLAKTLTAVDAKRSPHHDRTPALRATSSACSPPRRAHHHPGPSSSISSATTSPRASPGRV